MSNKSKEKKSKDIKRLEGELESCEKEKLEYLEGWKRAKADFINYKKNETEKMNGVKQRAVEGVFKDLMSVLDSFELGLRSAEKEEVIKKDGVVLIKNQLTGTLEKHGMKRIEVIPGDDFDTGRHEAVGEVSSDKPPGSVAEEVEAGYKVKDKVLRPAKVFVSREDENNES